MALTMTAVMARAQLTTKGDGTTYNIESLAAIAEAGIVGHDEPHGGQPYYELHQSITIAAGDKFVMDDYIYIFSPGVTLTVAGEGDFTQVDCAILKAPEGQASLCIESSTLTPFKNCHFVGVGLEVRGTGGIEMSHSTFQDHDGSSAAALYFINAGAASLISDCSFDACAKAAIGSAANAPQPLTIKDCVLTRNSTANKNIPQINLTAASPLVISGCTITGTPENNMVGGIGISNFMSYDADVTISGCTVTDNRYGIGIVGPAAKIVMQDNHLVNNRYETNPMNGGSGISLYDPYRQTNAVITRNHIEGSLWGVTVIGCKSVNLGCLDKSGNYNPGGNVFKDNGNGGVLYDLYNNSDLTIYAQNNTWNVSEQTEEQIESVVFHQHDDAKLGRVIFMPAAANTGIGDCVESTPAANAPVYNLNGQRVSTMRRGLYIKNGRKRIF